MNLDNLTLEEVRAIQISDIRARLAARTQGSWIATLDNHGWCISSVPDEGTPKERMETLARLNSGSPTSDTADACFIAAAPDDITILLAEVERLQAREAELLRWRDEWAIFKASVASGKESAFARGVEAMRMAVLAEFERWFMANESAVTFVRSLRVLSVSVATS